MVMLLNIQFIKCLMNNFTDKTFKIVNRKIKLNNYKKKKKIDD